MWRNENEEIKPLWSEKKEKKELWNELKIGWGNEYDHYNNPTRPKIKDEILLARALRIDYDLYLQLYPLIYNFSEKKGEDRDTEINICLNFFELVPLYFSSLDPDYSIIPKATELAIFEINREINFKRISPKNAFKTYYLIRDLFSKNVEAFNEFMRTEFILREEKGYYSQNIFDIKKMSIKKRANELFCETDNINDFNNLLENNPNLVIENDMELNIFFDILEATSKRHDVRYRKELVATLGASEINREIALKRIKPENVYIINELVNRYMNGILDDYVSLTNNKNIKRKTLK